MEKKHFISSVKDIWLGYGVCITSRLYKPKIHPVNKMVEKADALNEHLD